MKNTRQRALFIIDHVFYKGAFLEEELEILKRSKLEERDFNFIRELATGVIRHRSYLDYIIKKKSKVKFKKIHHIILTILEMGIYQSYFMDKVPNHAIVSESVQLAKIYGNRGSISYVNGMLRNIVKSEKVKVTIEDPVQKLATEYSHPVFYVDYFYHQKGKNFTEELLQANNRQAPFTLRVNHLKKTGEELMNELTEQGYQVVKGFLPESIYVNNPSGIFETDAFNRGDFYVQDEGSMMVSKIVDPQEGERILDLCAAPGGKTTHMAALSKNRAEIVACDKSEYKLSLIRENCSRLGVKGVTVKLNDGRIECGEFLEAFDKVLLDAPCSAIGLYRRKPDIKWNRNIEDLKALAKIQREILEMGARYLRLGGRLIYSTCSLSEIENEEVLFSFLKDHPNFQLEEIEDRVVTKLFTNETGTDGFSIFSVRRVE